jgi:hypothetical protein
MGPGSATQLCPRCGVALPASARFCRNCGLTLTASMDAVSPPPLSPTYAPAYTPPADPAANRWSAQGAAQANYQPPNPAYANPPIGSYASYNAPVDDYPAYDDEPEKPKRAFWRSFRGCLVISFLLLLVLGVSAFGIYFYPSLCSVGARSGLQSDIPLPCGLTYQGHLDRSASGATGPGSQEWVYTVDSTSPAQIKSFYQSNLPTTGWDIPAAAQNNQSFPDALLACKGTTLAVIQSTQQSVQEGDFTFSPPPGGGSVLLIILAPIKNMDPTMQQALGPNCHV